MNFVILQRFLVRGRRSPRESDTFTRIANRFWDIPNKSFTEKKTQQKKHETRITIMIVIVIIIIVIIIEKQNQSNKNRIFCQSMKHTHRQFN